MLNASLIRYMKLYYWLHYWKPNDGLPSMVMNWCNFESYSFKCSREWSGFHACHFVFACFFQGLDGQSDPNSVHGGCEVLAGEKWSATKWMRQRTISWFLACPSYKKSANFTVGGWGGEMWVHNISSLESLKSLDTTDSKTKMNMKHISSSQMPYNSR